MTNLAIILDRRGPLAGRMGQRGTITRACPTAACAATTPTFSSASRGGWAGKRSSCSLPVVAPARSPANGDLEADVVSVGRTTSEVNYGNIPAIRCRAARQLRLPAVCSPRALLHARKASDALGRHRSSTTPPARV